MNKNASRSVNKAQDRLHGRLVDALEDGTICYEEYEAARQAMNRTAAGFNAGEASEEQALEDLHEIERAAMEA